MITSSQIYWVTRLDSFNDALLIIGVIFGIICLIAGIFLAGTWGEPYGDTDLPKAKRWFFRIFWIPILCIIISTFLPTTKEMAAIFILPKIMNSVSQNEELKKLPNNILELANEWIETLKPEKKK